MSQLSVVGDVEGIKRGFIKRPVKTHLSRPFFLSSFKTRGKYANKDDGLIRAKYLHLQEKDR